MDSILFPGLLAESGRVEAQMNKKIMKFRKLAMGAELVSDLGAAKFFIVQ